MSRNYYCIAFCLLQTAIFVQATGLYTVIGPGTIRSNYKYNVSVSVHKADGPCTIKVGITGPSYNETKTIELQPMSTEDVQFVLPKLANGDYNLTASGVAGITFENSTKLNYADSKQLIFIQTDKATYKPGDVVHFRIVCLDENTRPATITTITVIINDGAQNRIKQLKDVKLTKGVYTGELQLSEQPVLGNWQIEAAIDGDNKETKSFEVAKYVLPKFEVTIETAKDVAIPDNVIKVTVRSKYTYGKPVVGKATVSIKPSYHYYGSSNDKLEAVKTIDVNGKGHVEFDLKNDLRVTPEHSYVPPLQILAIMEETLTGNKQNTTATVNLHAERYRIEGVETPHTYSPGKPIIFKIVVKKVDGKPVQDTKNPVKLIIEPPRNYFVRRFMPTLEMPTPAMPTIDAENSDQLVFVSQLNEQGIATFEFSLPSDSNRGFYSVKAQYLDSTSYLSSLSLYTPVVESLDFLKITVNTEKPQLGKDISIEIKSTETIPYFVYTLVARGNILQTEYVDVPKGRKVHTMKITPTFEMVPKVTMYVHYVDNDNLRFVEKSITLEKTFANSIEISAQTQAKPSEDVQLKIKTDPDSFVGLLGVDQSVLLLKSGNDFDKEHIFNSLSNFDTSTPWTRGYGTYPGQASGLVTLTNANYPYNTETYHDELLSFMVDFAEDETDSIDRFDSDVSSTSSVAATENNVKIRHNFIESWIVNFNIFEGSSISNDTDGFTFTKKIPDTITSWVITGFSLNPNSGFALTENPTKIQVFQPFFVSTNLPYSVKRGEVIAIPVVIFNYMEKNLDAEVTMDNTDGEYEFTEATNEVDESPIDEVKRIKRVSIPSNSGRSISFLIRPKTVGLTMLKITAITPLAGDAIHQPLKVEPEGVTHFENRAVFINLKDKNEHSEVLTADIPATAVLFSEFIELLAVGDLLGPTIKNLDKLVRMPYGCGEQNMVNFVPNILVLRYLAAINQENPSITEKAKKFLEIGYQRELTYKHPDGSYSAFGTSDKAGSTWLTAYVVRSFHQAANYTDIDPKVILEGLNFLASKQVENGSFPEYGKLFDSSHQNELGLTASVLLAFLENVEHIPKYQANIDKGMEYLSKNVVQSDDQYSLSIAALALQQARNPLADKILAKLQSLAKQENDRKWWSKDTQIRSDEPTWYWRPRSNDVEITSYVLLALLETEAAEAHLPIIKWLISQRNSNGGFSSTQDTVVGLQALIKFAEKTGAGSGKMDIEFVSSGGEENKGTISVNPDNSLVLQTHVLPKSTRQVNFTAKGEGSAMVQLSYRYNLAEKDKKPSFTVKATVQENKLPQQLIVEVCVEYQPTEDSTNKKESNMAVLEVALPSGYTANTDSFDKIKTVDRVKRTETKNSDSTILVYFDSLTVGDMKCLPIEATRTHAVAKQKPAVVVIYDYYNTGLRATDSYQVKGSLCEICEGEDCGPKCKSNSTD